MQEAAKYKVRPRPASTGGVVGERGHQDGFGLLLCGICVLQSLEKTGRVQMRGESMLISIDIFGFFEGREALLHGTAEYFSAVAPELVQRRCRAAMTAQTRSRIRARSRWA